MSEKIIHGTTLWNGRFTPPKVPKKFIFEDDQSNMFAVDQASVFKSILLLGAPGSGKTNVIFQFVRQLLWDRENKDAIHVIFDTKGDYITRRGFFRSGDYVLGNGEEYRRRSVRWNLFLDVMIDGSEAATYESNAREIASILFSDRRSETQPFFANAARDIFSSSIIYFIRRAQDEPRRWGDKLNNRCLVNFLMRAEAVDISNMGRIYPDMRGLNTYLGNGETDQALGVFGELRSMLYDCFQDIFRMEPEQGDTGFSIRRAVRDKGGRNIFIEYDLAKGEVLTPMYRMLVDLALKEALGRSANGNTYLVLDELKLLPRVTHLEDALNFGRGRRVCIIAGIQNVNQMYAIYGHERGQSILGGFGTVISMALTDAESREYVTRLYGTNLLAYDYRSRLERPVEREREGHTVEDWDQRRLSMGDAVVGLASQNDPFFFHFSKDVE